MNGSNAGLGASQAMSASDAFSKQAFTDLGSLQNLKALGREDRDQAIEQIAKQFESIFTQQMLKGMRQANDVLAEGGLFNSNEMKFHRDMLDQQLGLSMTQGRGLGLADTIVRQLKRQYAEKEEGPIAALNAVDPAKGIALEGPALKLNSLKGKPDLDVTVPELSPARLPAQMPANAVSPEGIEAQSADVLEKGIAETPRAENLNKLAILKAAVVAPEPVNAPQSIVTENAKVPEVPEVPEVPSVAKVKADAQAPVIPGPIRSPEEFVDQLLPYAKAAARILGVDYKVILAQSALESGWGQADNGNNVFGIKADQRWQGEVNNKQTLEYVNGQAQLQNEPFRQYQHAGESFKDYAAFIKHSGRYNEALGQTDPEQYIKSLQTAGYATDPAYAEKVMRVYHSEPMRLALANSRGES
jgi:flagellar protein FlgJ